jgi:hypothetical protein
MSNLVASSCARIAVLQVPGFEHGAMPDMPAISAGDSYSSGYLDSLLSQQVY